MTVEKVAAAYAVVKELFAKHGISDPSQAKREIAERFSQDELERYEAARDYLDEQGAMG